MRRGTCFMPEARLRNYIVRGRPSCTAVYIRPRLHSPYTSSLDPQVGGTARAVVRVASSYTSGSRGGGQTGLAGAKNMFLPPPNVFCPSQTERLDPPLATYDVLWCSGLWLHRMIRSPPSIYSRNHGFSVRPGLLENPLGASRSDFFFRCGFGIGPSLHPSIPP